MLHTPAWYWPSAWSIGAGWIGAAGAASVRGRWKRIGRGGGRHRHQGSPRRTTCDMDSGAPLDSATVSIARIAQTGLPGRPAAGTIARRSIHAALAALLLAIAGTGAALAHAELVASDPADGDVLDASPTTIRLAFSENLDPAEELVQAARARRGGDRDRGHDGGQGDVPPSPLPYPTARTRSSGPRRRPTTATSSAGNSPSPSSSRPRRCRRPPRRRRRPPRRHPRRPRPRHRSPPPSAAPSVAPTPAPSAAAATAASSTSDVLLPIVIGLLIVAGVGAYVLRRSRGA